jgi:uncharacterized protein YbjQ (UPF0145 family)
MASLFSGAGHVLGGSQEIYDKLLDARKQALRHLVDRHRVIQNGCFGLVA